MQTPESPQSDPPTSPAATSAPAKEAVSLGDGPRSHPEKMSEAKPEIGTLAIPAVSTAVSPDISPDISVVVPAYNEADNLATLTAEILDALTPCWPACEVLLVDDASTDQTETVVQTLRNADHRVRYLRHRANSGQSAAVWSGVQAARAPVIATLDGDGQNNPASIPDLLERYTACSAQGPVIVCGIRTRRQDTWSKKAASRLANGIRRWLLQDVVTDSGCGLKVFARGDFLALPPFNHMHRFLPALMKAAGARIESVPVHHRPRTFGVSKYGVGGRALVGLYDLVGVAWLMRRRLHRGYSLTAGREPWDEPGA